MNSTTESIAPKEIAPKKSPRYNWHLIYYLLAAFNVLTLATGLYLNQRIIGIYTRSVAENQEWAGRLVNYSELGLLAGTVDAPGNDIFDSHDVAAESERMRAAQRAFNERLQKLRDDLQAEKSQTQLAPIYEDIDSSLNDMKAIHTAMNDLTQEAEQIFSYFRQNQVDLAGRRMATMDRKYAQVRTEVAHLRKDIGVIQQKLFDQETVAATSVKNDQHMIAVLCLLMLCGAIVYGSKIKERMDRDLQERNRYNDELRAAEAALRKARNELEVRVQERTVELLRANDGLHSEIMERKRAEEELRKSEERFQLATRATNDAIWDWDLTTNSVWWNEGYQAMFGYRPDEIVAGLESWISNLHPDDLERVTHSIHDVFNRGEQSWAGEYRFRRADGSYAFVSDRGHVVRDDNGKPVRMLGSMTDITERKQAETLKAGHNQVLKLLAKGGTLEDALKLLVYAIEAQVPEMMCSVLLLDEKGEYLRFAAAPNLPDAYNHAIDGLAIGPVAGSCGTAVYRKESVIVEDISIDPLWENGRELALQHGLRACWSQPIISDEGDVLGTLAMYYRQPRSVRADEIEMIENAAKLASIAIERKRMEAEIEQARDAALESARLKSEFLANMSHEIRTPMNGVIGMTALMLDGELTDEQREFTETIRSSADSLLTIINDILDFSKIEAGKLNFEKLDFDLRGVVESTIELLAERAQAKGLELASLVDSRVPTEVRGDAGRLRQVLINLVSNALKFTEAGEVTVSATKESETDTHVVVRLAIRDTGIGVSPEAQRRLFQAFTQADGSTTRKYGGTGLGLAICKQLVELMGGEIGVESEPGAGSTFWFTVRLEKQAANTELHAFLPRAELHDLRVLIVDDNATNRKILIHQTTSWGMIPAESESGAAALEELRRAREKGEPYDVALLDFHMPGMDGFELARAIKADAQIASVRLVLMPSFGNRGDGQAAREAGIAGYLMKPVRQSQLFDCLATVMVNSETDTPSNSAAHKLVTRHSLVESRLASRVRILIAEDNPVNQKVATRQVEKLGYRADLAANGIEALEALARCSYDIVLMDCQMPLMDGYEATAKIREREGASRHTVIIAMTAHALEGDREKCLAAGMDDYLSKPVRTDELDAVLERWHPDSSRVEKESASASIEQGTAPESAPVDMDRLRDIAGGDDGLLHELIDIYLRQTAEDVQSLNAAIAAGDASEVKRLAHTCGGGSSTCGMVAIVAPLRELERLADGGHLGDEAKRLGFVAAKEFERIKFFLQNSLKEPANV